MQKKTRKMFFSFWNNCIWRCCNKLSLSRRRYLSSAVNVLTNSPKILHITRKTFSNWIALTVISKYGKGAVVQNSTVFRPASHVTCPRVHTKTRLFRHLSNHVFGGPSVQKHISYEGHIFFQNDQNWISIFKMQKKIEKKFFFLI